MKGSPNGHQRLCRFIDWRAYLLGLPCAATPVPAQRSYE